MARKRVCIVFEETDENSLEVGQGFQVFIEGAERTKSIPKDKWSAAEFWGMHCFGVVAQILKTAIPGSFERRKGD